MSNLVVGILNAKLTVRADGRVHTFALDDVDGPAEVLREHDGRVIMYGSSVDFPQESGAPKGWRFDPHWKRVQKKASS
jgi:hypothetical protein